MSDRPGAASASSSTFHPGGATDGSLAPHHYPRHASDLTPSLSTLLLHADEPDLSLNPISPVAPDVNLSTTYRHPHPSSQLAELGEEDYDFQRPQAHIYSRYTQDARNRVEVVLSKLLDGHAVTYASGLNAAYAVALHYQPRVIALRRGYFGCHESFHLYAKTKGNVQFIDLDAEYPPSTPDSPLLVWLETPLNPSGEARDIAHYVSRAHAAGGYLAVDSTFAPPPLQNPFAQGADMVMHSGTKYFGGHSDLLMGVLAVKELDDARKLWHDRTYMGSTPGNLESYLLLRSLRTLSVRVERQSETATRLAGWLWTLCPCNEGVEVDDERDRQIRENGIVGWVAHGSLQPRGAEMQDTGSKKQPEGVNFDPRPQMPGGFSPTFSIRISGGQYAGGARAAYLPHQTQYWIPATSLGGVESLIEQRIAAEKSEDPGTVRLSVGLEAYEDLRDDLRRALLKVVELDGGTREGGRLGWKAAEAHIRAEQAKAKRQGEV